jgi:hypothetical protein
MNALSNIVGVSATNQTFCIGFGLAVDGQQLILRK